MSDRGSFLSARILVVDDKPDNIEIVSQLLTASGYTSITPLQDPARAVELILQSKADLVLLDLHMPKMTGFEVLEQVAGAAGDSDVPILAFTADSTPQARQRALDLGACDFITKPFDATELLLRVRNFLRLRLLHLTLHDENEALEVRVQNRTRKLMRARTEALQCLARAAEYRDDATGEHVRRVGELSARIAQALGLSEDIVETIRLAAPLHDIGKIGVPDAILMKPGKLTPEEFSVMQQHAIIGASIIGKVGSPLLRTARQIALFHHEAWDGSGYPSGAKKWDIPIESRIVAVADMFDALTHERPYKHAWTVAESLKEIEHQGNRKLDPAVVEAMLSLHGRKGLAPRYAAVEMRPTSQLKSIT